MGMRRGAASVLLVAFLSFPAGAQEKEPPPPPPSPPGPWNPPVRTGPPPTDPKTPLPDRVNLAIDAGVAWLRTRITVGGSFGTLDQQLNYLGDSNSYLYPAGPTALAVYTLLKCGVPADDPVVARALAWLRAKHEVPGTSYEISVLILALEAKSDPRKRAKSPASRGRAASRPSAEDLAWMRKLVAQLLRRRQSRPGWRYNCADPAATGPIQDSAGYGGDVDMSSTQLAMLALAAAERCGIRQPDDLYLQVVRWVLDEQEKSGPAVPAPEPPGGGGKAVSAVADAARGWGYLPRDRSPGQVPTGSMTACGLGNVVIAGGILAARENREWRTKLADRAEAAWRDGNAWLSTHWKIASNPGGASNFYWLYCLERAGDLRGVSLLGGHDWYAEGAGHLVDVQYPDGSWWGLGEPMPSDLLGTCFALLFLDRSTRGVASGGEPR